MDPQDPKPPSELPGRPDTDQPLPAQPPAKRRFWEQPLAILGVALGFFPYVIPGFFALRSYSRWREGKIAKPRFAWIWAGIMTGLLTVAGIALFNAYDKPVVWDFDDGTGDGDWSTDSDNLVSLEFVDGGYRFLIKDPSQPQSSREFFTDAAFHAISLEADVTERVGPTTDEEAQGLWCLQSPDAGYLFAVAASGDYAIFKQPASPGAATLTSGTNVSAIRVLGKRQNLRLDCSGGGNGPTVITGFVDGTKVAEVRDPEGYDSFKGIGLFVVTSVAGTDVLWDNVVARPSIPSAPSQFPHPSPLTTSPTSRIS